jgi:DNA-binding NtrC family response regulator
MIDFPGFEDFLRSVAPTDATVLVQGGGGTTREMIARMIHLRSPRASRPHATLACSALSGVPEAVVEGALFGHEEGAFPGALGHRLGCFEKLQGGTVFLQDIDALPQPLQMKLLRVVEERRIQRLGGEKAMPVDFRLIAGTQVDLEQATCDGRFCEDLFRRLNQVLLRLPPLLGQSG